MTKLTSLLVGAHFRPPAKALLASLPAGTPLELDPEPDNPYDSEALAVWINCEAIPGLTTSPEFENENALADALASQGFTPEDLLAQPRWQLGYVAAKGNKGLFNRPDLVPNGKFLELMAGTSEWEAKLAWGPSGEPQVELEAPGT